MYTLNKRSASLALTFCLFHTVASMASAEDLILRVDIENGSISANGQQWQADAIKFLLDALTMADAHLAENPAHSVEIWVAAGTYVSTGWPFELRDNVGILGGFIGGESARHERDPLQNITILTGQNSPIVRSISNGATARLDGPPATPARIGEVSCAARPIRHVAAANGFAVFDRHAGTDVAPPRHIERISRG